MGRTEMDDIAYDFGKWLAIMDDLPEDVYVMHDRLFFMGYYVDTNYPIKVMERAARCVIYSRIPEKHQKLLSEIDYSRIPTGRFPRDKESMIIYGYYRTLAKLRKNERGATHISESA